MEITLLRIFLARQACSVCKLKVKMQIKEPDVLLGLCVDCYESYSNYCKKTYEQEFMGMKDEN